MSETGRVGYKAMCGVAGVVLKGVPNRQFVEDCLVHLKRDLEHRGPDSYGVHVEGNYGFLNRRLAIVDIAGGDQPIYNETGDVGIVYNGEVYNHAELKARYEEKGIQFRTSSDTEVVLQGYVRDGVASFAALEGMFAFCIWNSRTGEIYVARDVFGMKPLYLYEDRRMIIFASEIGAISNVPGVDMALDPRAVRDYLAFRYVVGPYTIYRNIRRVAAGTYVRLSAAGCREHVFADLCQKTRASVQISYAEAQEELRSVLLESVRSHLIGEVPIALLLSGGVDSSILAALLHRLQVPMHCFNIGFSEVNEFAYSNAVAEKYGFQMHNIEISSNDIADSFPNILRHLDEPVADPAQFPLYLLCSRIRRYATVVLSGEGADELFGGYPQYLTHTQPLTGSERLPHFLASSYYFLENDSYMPKVPIDGGWRRTAKYFQGETILGAMSNYDLATWIPENLMMKADKMAMRHSLEGRFPYLNRRLVSLVRSLPSSFLIGPNNAFKRILKDAFAEMVPATVLARPKMGFTVPVRQLLQGFAERYRETLDGLVQTDLAEILDLEAVRSLFERFVQRDGEETLLNWSLFILTSWVSERYRVAADKA